MSNVIDIKKGRRRGREPGPPPPAPVGTIALGNDLHRVVDEAKRALAAYPNLYQREAELVQVIEAPAEDPCGAGSPIVRPIHQATLRAILTQVARFVRLDGRTGEWTDTLPTDAVVQAVLHAGHWPGVPVLTGLVETPSLRPDGSVIQARGYDHATGFVYVPSMSFPTIAERPTQADARAAYGRLADVFADFPHERRDVHVAATIAAILTVIARPAIAGAVPGIGVVANTRGSGKTLKTDAVCLVATGRSASRMTFTLKPEEQEKIIASFALRGASVVVFDNCTVLGGEALDKVLTAVDRVDLRVLGRSEIATLPWRAVVVANGNNIELRGDTARRFLIVRLETLEERPEERTGFRHVDLRSFIRENRASLVADALTVLRAWFVAGRPGEGEFSWGSFEKWASIIPPAIAFAGGANVLEARAEVDDDHEDPERTAFACVLAGLRKLDPEGAGLTVKALIDALYPQRREMGPPDGFDEVREAVETLVPCIPGKPPSSDALGRVLRARKKSVIQGMRLVAKPGRGGVMRWAVESVSPIAA